MAQDYLARKAAKKRAKKIGGDSREGDGLHGGSKSRPVRGTPKKRMGVCFGQPVVTQADKFDSGDEMPQDPTAFDVLAGAGIGEALTWASSGAPFAPAFRVWQHQAALH
jgi:hypothetical protein